MEKRILNTLFVQQVNLWPEPGTRWTFIITGSYEYTEAKGKLLGKGFIGETKEHMIFITNVGYDYCIDHYDEIKNSGRWWDEIPVDDKNLRKVLARELRPKD
jgi:hypothetical protein